MTISAHIGTEAMWSNTDEITDDEMRAVVRRWQEEADAHRRQAEASCFLRAWFLFVGPDGEPSAGRDALHVIIGATRSGRVRVLVPDGVALGPKVAATIAARVAEAALAEDPDPRLAPEVAISMPGGMAPGDAAGIAEAALSACHRVQSAPSAVVISVTAEDIRNGTGQKFTDAIALAVGRVPGFSEPDVGTEDVRVELEGGRDVEYLLPDEVREFLVHARKLRGRKPDPITFMMTLRPNCCARAICRCDAACKCPCPECACVNGPE